MDAENFEYERRFVVREVPGWVREEPDPAVIVQSYLLAEEGFAVRVRLQATAPEGADLHALDETGILDAVAHRATMCSLTAKGPYIGGTRYEAEREIDPAVAQELVRRGPRKVAKIRHSVWLGSDGWVIDEFLGGNAPLVIAECERGSPVVDLTIPEFCVTEISEDPRFSNDSLSSIPYGTWARRYEAELARTGPSFSTAFGTNTR